MNTCPSAYLNNARSRKAVEMLVHKCGVRADLKGFDCLVDAVMLYSAHASRSFYAIYELVGEYRNVKPKTVLREISYSIMQARDISSRLNEMLDCRIEPSDIHSSLVIAYLGKLSDQTQFGCMSCVDFDE